MATLVRQGPDVSFSLYRFLRTTTYTVGATTTTLQSHHQGLRIIGAYPDDLTAIRVPTLAVMGYDDDVEEQGIFGTPEEAISEDLYTIRVYGFVVLGESQPDQAHLRYRDRLRSDLVLLLRRVAGQQGITLYDSLTKTAYGVVEVINVRSRLIPVSAPDFAADRYKFVVEGIVPYAGTPGS